MRLGCIVYIIQSALCLRSVFDYNIPTCHKWMRHDTKRELLVKDIANTRDVRSRVRYYSLIKHFMSKCNILSFAFKLESKFLKLCSGEKYVNKFHIQYQLYKNRAINWIFD